MSTDPPQAAGLVYQLKVVLRDCSPLIWRRLLVPGETTIAQLHTILQTVMGWEDLHLHRFRIHGKEYGVYHEGGIVFADDPHQVRLAAFKLRRGERFVYEYDLSDFWQHDLYLEQVLPCDPRKHYPVCPAGAGDCPPEECGGPWGYQRRRQERSAWPELLQARKDLGRGAERLLAFVEGGPRPTYEDEEFMAALERMQARIAAAPTPFQRRAVNAALRTLIKELPGTSASNSSPPPTTAPKPRRKSRS